VKGAGRTTRGGTNAPAPSVAEQLELRPGQSLELLKALHILTREGKLNQDSRRKLKQVYHLYQFIEPILQELTANDHPATPGRPWRGQVLPGLHPVRPVLPRARARQHLRH